MHGVEVMYLLAAKISNCAVTMGSTTLYRQTKATEQLFVRHEKMN